MAETPRQRTAPPGAIYDAAARFQDELALTQTAAADQMVAAWQSAYERSRDELQALLDKIAAARAAGEPVSPAWLNQQDRLANAMQTIADGMGHYAEVSAQATETAQQASARASQRHHAALTQTALGDAGMAASFTAVDATVTTAAAGYLSDGSPLADLFRALGDESLQAARAALVDGLTLGKGTDWMARQLAQALDLPRHRAVTIMRTESQRVYRQVARETYQANAEVLEGWEWHAHLGPRTCAACLAMHGTIHPVTETLDGHPRCRCAMVPRTKSWEELGVEGMPDTRPPTEDAEAWLRRQPERTQRAVLGRAKLRAWKGGEVSLKDMVARTHSDRWGTMRRERSLLEIREGRNANTLPAERVRKAPAQPEARAVLSPDQHAALMPSRGGWTTKTREKTLATLKSTPEGKVLAKTLDSFQSGGSTAIPRLRTDIEKYLQGGDAAAELAEGRVESVRTLLGAIADSDAGDRALYRGMSIPGSAEEVLARYAPGSEVNLSLASFSSDAKLAQGFSIKGAGQRVKGATQTPVVVEWVGAGKRALPIENLGKSRVFAQEREWVGQGRYVVEEAKVAKRGGVPTVVVRMRQEATWR